MGNQISLTVARVLTGTQRSTSLRIAVALGVVMAAYKAAQTKDLAALEELNNALYESCESCHMATR